MHVMPGGRRRGLLGCRLRYVLPHDVEYSRANQTVLDRAREEKGAGVLDERAHDIRAPALEHVVGTLETAGDTRVLLHQVLGVVAVATEVQVTSLCAL